MSKPILFFVAGVLTTIACAVTLFLPAWLFDLGNNGAVSYGLVKTAPSPNGKYAASIYTASGGGAAGWCHRRVAVTKKDAPFDFVTKDKDLPSRVFDTTCRSEIELAWQGDKHLIITYLFTGSPEFGDQTFQKIVSEDKEVKISFVSK